MKMKLAWWQKQNTRQIYSTCSAMHDPNTFSCAGIPAVVPTAFITVHIHTLVLALQPLARFVLGLPRTRSQSPVPILDLLCSKCKILSVSVGVFLLSRPSFRKIHFVESTVCEVCPRVRYGKSISPGGRNCCTVVLGYRGEGRPPRPR